MGKLIDRGKFWDNLNDEFEMGVTDAIEAVNNALDNTPAVDAVPVIRCKDCKYYRLRNCYNECNHPAYLHDVIISCDDDHTMRPDPDFFCPYGERVNKPVETVDK